MALHRWLKQRKPEVVGVNKTKFDHSKIKQHYKISFFFSLNSDGVTPNFDLNTVGKYPCEKRFTLNATSAIDLSLLFTANTRFAICKS